MKLLLAFLLVGGVSSQVEPTFVLSPSGTEGGCLVEENVNYAEDLLVVDGGDNTKPTLKDCCDQCIANPLCNVFVYCDNSAGCGPQSQFDFRRCDLKFQATIANGGMPFVYTRGPEETFTSGYLPDKVVNKGIPEALCPSNGLIIVFGETYPSIQANILAKKDVMDFITAKATAEEMYMHSISGSSFCVLDDGEIVGDLLIYADESFPENLEPLSDIQSITGDLIVIASNSTTLDSLEGLDSLAEIGGSLYVDGVDSLMGLKSLRSVGEHVILKNIQDFKGTSLKQIEGDLRVSGENVVSLAGLGAISKVGGNVGIIQTSLVDLVGLRGLVEIGGALLINNNEDLRSFEGLDNLLETESLIISKNPVLKFLNPLTETLDVAKNVHIYENGGISRNASQTLFAVVEGSPATLEDLRSTLVELSDDI